MSNYKCTKCEESDGKCKHCGGVGYYYPQHEALKKVSDKSQAIGEFMD